MKLRHILYLCLWLSGGVVFSPLAQATPQAQASGINDTGITTCSDTTQNGLTCPVPNFLRQDAEYGPNSFSFTKLDAAGNPLPDTATNQVCVRDNYTGLIWEVKTADGGLRDKNKTYTFDQAPAFATAVNSAGGLCGFTDWRVPNPQELSGLVNYSIAQPGPAVDTGYFPNSLGMGFWTNSSYAYDSSNAWVVYFVYGGVYFNSRANANDVAVRLVRGGQHFASLHDNSDGTITDANTGLMWEQCPEGQSGSDCSTGSATAMNWSQALTAAAGSTLAGYSDWRLPNVKELNSIVDYSTSSPSINATNFPNSPIGFFWSSSSNSNDSSGAWVADFDTGYIAPRGNSTPIPVRLVRGGAV